MKRITIISLPVILLLLLFGSLQNKATAQEEEQVSYQTFYDELSPYGSWIDYPEYGYVWRPDMGPDFRPYSTNGHWVWSDEYEWMWVSDYSWGWAPFHYGRWFYDDYYGWLWIPGYDWSPAWVCWRSGGDYYGWAPLGPQFRVGVNLSFGSYSPPSNYWCFVDRQYIASPRVYDHCYGVQRNSVFINNTTIINNYHRERNVYVTGPGRREVERYTGQSIRSVGIRDAARPGRTDFRNNEVAIYRPRIDRDNNHYAPERFQRFNRGQYNNSPSTGGGWGEARRGNMGGFEQRQQQDQMIRQRNADAENNRRQFEQQRQQQDQMMRQRNADAENNRRQFEQQRQQQDQMMRQRNADAENNRRQFEQQRQQQEQMMRQRNADAENNRRQFEQRQQQPQFNNQQNNGGFRGFRGQQQQPQQQQPQFERRNPEPGNQQGGGRFGGFRGGGQQQPPQQAQPQQNRGDNQQGGGRFGGWRHN